MDAWAPNMRSVALLLVSALSVSALVACADESSSRDEPITAADKKTPAKEAACQGDACGPSEDPYGDTTAPETENASEPTSPEPAQTSANASCETAKDLGSMNGDIGEATFSAQGSCTSWYKVRVTEGQSWDTPPQRIDIQLVSPDDEKFDVFVHVDPDADRVECTTVYAKSDTPTGRIDNVPVSWGDNWWADDSRTVMIEVKSKSGRCSQKGTFSLVVEHKPFGVR